jgi:predicted nucleotidyltransferase
MKDLPNFQNADFNSLFDRVIEDLKSHPKIVGISLHGSLVSGDSDEFSDVDLDILLWRDWEDLKQMPNDLERLVLRPSPGRGLKRCFPVKSSTRSGLST